MNCCLHGASSMHINFQDFQSHCYSKLKIGQFFEIIQWLIYFLYVDFSLNYRLLNIIYKKNACHQEI